MLMAEQPPRAPPAHARLHPPRGGGVTPLEVGMYVLLAVFGAAIVIFAASYVVYTWNVHGGGKARRPPAPLSSLTPSQDSVTNAHDWVWLGRATLERASGVGMSPPQPPQGGFMGGSLLMSDMNGNTPPPAAPAIAAPQPQRGSWRGSERDAPINITSNPVPDSEPPAAPPSVTPTAPSSLAGGTTFTRPPRNLRRVTFTHPEGDDAPSSEDDRPPVPPHRNIGVTTHPPPHEGTDSPPPPPVPPHGVHIINNPMDDPHRPRQTHTEPRNAPQSVTSPEVDTRFVEVNAEDFVRLRGGCRGRGGEVRRATIMENPLLSAHLPDNLTNLTPAPHHLDNLTPNMDYDQLMAYFSNLKESNA